MPGCYLQVRGEEFDIDAALVGAQLDVGAIWRRGEKRFKTSNRISEDSGCRILVSDADGGHVPIQISEAIEFLNSHVNEVRKLVSSPGVGSAMLDFGWDFPGALNPAQWNIFPIDLIQRCADLRLSLCVSVYGDAEEYAKKVRDERCAH